MGITHYHRLDGLYICISCRLVFVVFSGIMSHNQSMHVIPDKCKYKIYISYLEDYQHTPSQV